MKWNCFYFFLDHDPIPDVDLYLFTDAVVGVFYGGVFCSRWFANSWSDFLQLFHTHAAPPCSGSSRTSPLLFFGVLNGPDAEFRFSARLDSKNCTWLFGQYCHATEIVFTQSIKRESVEELYLSLWLLIFDELFALSKSTKSL